MNRLEASRLCCVSLCALVIALRFAEHMGLTPFHASIFCFNFVFVAFAIASGRDDQ